MPHSDACSPTTLRVGALRLPERWEGWMDEGEVTLVLSPDPGAQHPPDQGPLTVEVRWETPDDEDRLQVRGRWRLSRDVRQVVLSFTERAWFLELRCPQERCPGQREPASWGGRITCVAAPCGRLPAGWGDAEPYLEAHVLTLERDREDGLLLRSERLYLEAAS